MSLSDGGIQTTMPVAPANNYGGGMGMWGLTPPLHLRLRKKW